MQGVGKQGQWDGEKRWMPGVPANTFFSPCPWKTGVLIFSKKNMGIKDALLVMVVRLLLHGDPQGSCTRVQSERDRPLMLCCSCPQ